jgi:hypothetical protein
MTALDDRRLGRATLARQLLLERVRVDVPSTLQRLLALQAQWPRPPFVALWSRIQGFAREQLAVPLRDRTIVRATTFRGTLHVIGADDFLALRSTLQPVLERGLQQVLRAKKAELDFPKLVKRARAFFGRGARTFEAVRDHLAEADPDADERAMGYAVRNLLPLVQVPTDDVWAFPQVASFADAEAWLEKKIDPADRRADLVLRYLAALGPASIVDIQAFTGIAALAPVIEALGDRLVQLRDRGGKILFDLPDAPRPRADVVAPVRFLPEFDNAIVSRADGRILAEADRKHVFLSGLRVLPVVLVDGRAIATWKITRTKAKATLAVDAFAKLGKAHRAAVAEEGEALLRFAEPDAKTHDLLL